MIRCIMLIFALSLLGAQNPPAEAAGKCPSYTTKAKCVANSNCMWIERVSRCSMKRG